MSRPEETQDTKTGYWPQIEEVHIKGKISVTHILDHPSIKKH